MDTTPGRSGADGPATGATFQVCGADDAAGRTCALPVPHGHAHWAPSGIWGGPREPEIGLDGDEDETEHRRALPEAGHWRATTALGLVVGGWVIAAALASVILDRLRP